jgi:hypothetical protein
MGKIISIIMCGLFLVGTLVSCAPREVKPMVLTPIKFEKTQPIPNELDSIPDPGKPNTLMLDSNGQVTTDPAKAKYVAFTKEDFPKVVANLKLKQTYKEMYEGTLAVANQQVMTLNHLKELLAQDQQLIQLLNERQTYFENQYRQEVYDHRWDNVYHRSVIGVMGIGAIVIAILAM